MTIIPTAYAYALGLLNCLCAELQVNADADPTLPYPGRCCMRPGSDTVLDILDDGTDMCCEGEAYVKYLGQFPSSTFPEPDAEFPGGNCFPRGLAAAYEIGIIRCVPEQVDCDAAAESVRQLTADADAAYRAYCCWTKALGRLNPAAQTFVTGWEPFGPDGQCVGGSMQVFASLRGGCCPN